MSSTLFNAVPPNYVLTSGANSALTWTNAISVSSMNISSLGANALTVSTLTTSSAITTSSISVNSVGANALTVSTLTTSSLLTASTISATRLNYSSLVGSTVSTNTLTLSAVNTSTQNTQIYQTATTNPVTSYSVIQASHVSTGITNNNLALNPSGGNVGVGLPISQNTFHVFNSTASSIYAPDGDSRSGQILITNSKVGSSTYSMAIGMDQVTGIGYMNAAGNSVHQPICLNTRGGGNVGIGTTIPAGTLHVSGPGASASYSSYQMVVQNSSVPSRKCVIGVDATATSLQSVFNDNATAYLTLNPLGGNVGIGTNGPGYPLHVSGSALMTGQTGYYFGTAANTITSWNSGQGSNVTIRATNSVWCGDIFVAASDIRIKKNISPLTNSLQTIDQMNIVSYDKIDLYDNGVDAGVIAQEIKTLLPRAISKSSNILPNIYSRATHHTIDSTTACITVPCISSDIKDGVDVRIMVVKGDKEIYYDSALTQWTGESFIVEKWKDYSADDKIFVYGTKVDDFLSVDKDQIGILAAAGVKELHQIVIAQQQTINSLLAWAQTQGYVA